MQKRILVIDDDPRILELLAAFLMREGFAVETALDARIGLKILKNQKIDLVILDVMLPEISGFDFAKTIREGQDKTPIVMLTALTDEADRTRGQEAGVDKYMTKPFDPKKLLANIKSLLGDN